MKENKVCTKCGALVSKFAYGRHLNHCTGDISKFRGGKSKESKKNFFTGF